MQKRSTKNIVSFAAVAIVAATSAPAFADDDYDPLDGKAILSHAESATIDVATAMKDGDTTMEQVGKQLLARAIDSYVPGLSAVLGLGGNANESQKVIDAIAADGDKTRNVVLSFWDWAQLQSAATVNANYATVEYDISSWNALPINQRLQNRAQLANISHNCVSVIATLQNAASPLDRITYLHAYTTLLNLAIAIEAERSQLEIFGNAWETMARGATPNDWWNGLSSADQGALFAQIQNTKWQRVTDLLLPSLQVGFARQMNGMDQGTLVGGVAGQSDFVTARDWQFGPLNQVAPGDSGWYYYVGRDPEGNCVNGSRYCKAYFITQGSTSSTEGPRYFVDFKGGSGPFYPGGPNAAYEEHKALVLKDMIVRGYGPVRGFAENWWDIWGLGPRDRLGLDTVVDGYVDEADSQHSHSLSNLMTLMTIDIKPGERSYDYGFALAQGLTGIDAVLGVALIHRDWLAEPVLFWGQGWTPYPWSVHRDAMRLWPTSNDLLAAPYIAFPAAKYVTIDPAFG